MPSKRSIFFINSRGIYEMMSAFFLIILVVVVLLFMVYLGASSSANSAVLSNNIGSIQEAQSIRDNILSCWGFLEKSSISSANYNYCLPSKVKGYEFSVLNFLRCSENDLKKQFGDFSECKKKIPYFVSIVNDKGYSCLSRLTLCFG